MIKIIISGVFLFCFSIFSFGQIEKPKTTIGNTKSKTTTSTSSTSVTNATVEVTWKGPGPAKIKIGVQEFFLNEGSKKTIQLNSEEGYNISVIMPDLEYKYPKFFIPEKGKGNLDINLKNNTVEIHYISEKQKLEEQKALEDKKKNTEINPATYVFENNVLVVFQNGHKVTKDDFQYVYEKNIKDTNNHYDVNSYMNLYITFMQKVFEAQSLGMDTTLAFKKELSGYRSQIIKPFLKNYSESEAEQLPEFQFLYMEYYYGILLFEIMDKKVWTPAVKDTQGLMDYFAANKANYPNQTFELAEKKVIADYQNYLEKQWLIELNNKFPYKINQTLLNNLKTN